MTKLSIITVCCNIKDDIERTLKSIANQTFQDFEWIVIDGGSKDGTLEIIEKYKERIDVLISEKDNGIFNAMNKGIKLAKGEYLNFMNGGDTFFYDDVLKDVFQTKERFGDVLYGNAYCTKGDISKDNVWIMPDKVDKMFLITSCFHHQSTFIKKELFEKYGYYKEDYKIASDYERWFAFFENGAKFEYLPYIVSKYDTKGVSARKDMRKLANLERQQIVPNYMKSEDWAKSSNQQKEIKYSFFEKIFSLKNSLDPRYKIITILGIHIKTKRNKS